MCPRKETEDEMLQNAVKGNSFRSYILYKAFYLDYIKNSFNNKKNSNNLIKIGQKI